MSPSQRLASFSAVLVGLALSGEALAVVVLDQAFEPDLTNGGGITYVGNSNRFQAAQTFTVGVSGNLTSVDLLLLRHSAISDPLLVDVRTTLSGVPSLGDTGPHILSNAAVVATDIPDVLDPDLDDRFSAQFVHVDLPEFAVSVGDVYAIVLRSNEAIDGPLASYAWVAQSGAPGLPGPTYSAGARYIKAHPLASWSLSSTGDGGFRTYVQVIPEPQAATLFVAVIFGFLSPRSARSPSLRRSVEYNSSCRRRNRFSKLAP
jgi:hypothetical protein